MSAFRDFETLSENRNVELPPFIQKWQKAVESNTTPEMIARQCYHSDATLKGTISGEAIKGRKKIAAYFQQFTDGKSKILIDFKTITKTLGGAFTGEYTFKWTNEIGQAVSSEANYTFETIGDDVISHHHSSFDPEILK